jgi:transcriptional antiterminator RfaH
MSELILSDEPKWYCLRSQPKHEHIAAALLQKIEGVEIYCPRIRIQKSTRRGLVWFTEALFPNYFFARFSLRSLLLRIRSSPGVAGIVRFGGRYPEIAAEALEKLRDAMQREDVKTVVISLGEGDDVDIVDGPLRGTTGTITQLLPAHDRVKVLLDFIGGKMEVELGLATVFRPAPSLLHAPV